MHKRSIFGRAIILVTACILPIWLAEGVYIYIDYLHHVEITQQRLMETARALALAVDRELNISEAVLRSLATSPRLTPGSEDFPGFYRHALMTAQQEEAITLSLVDPSGQQIINTMLPLGTPPRPRTRMDAVTQVFERGQTAITDTWFGPLSGIPQYGVDVPVLRDGRVIYDLAISMPAERMRQVLLAQHLPAKALGGIIDHSGLVVARQPETKDRVGKPAPPPVLAGIRQAPEGLLDFQSFEGEAMTGAFSRSAVANWNVVMAVPTATFRAEVLSGLRLPMAINFAMSVAVVWAGIIFSRRIVQPINALIAPAQALGEGRLVTYASRGLVEADEVGQVLQAASRMLQTQQAERDKAERELQFQAEILSRVTDGVGVVSADQVIVFSNPALDALFGYGKGDLAGRPWQILVGQDNAEGIIEELQENGIWQGDLQNSHKDGSAFWTWTKISSHELPRLGRVWLSVQRDVTWRKDLERDLATAQAQVTELNAHMLESAETERQTVALEVHDQVGATLAGVRLQLEAMIATAAPENPATRAKLEKIMADVQSGVVAVRNLCYRLIPHALKDLGLAEACRSYLDDWASQSGINISGRFPRRRISISSQVKLHIYRILQELLTNVAKHAGATKVRVNLSTGGKYLLLSVTDDGHGFDPAAQLEGFGLRGIRQRLQTCGGHLDIGSGDRGTRVKVTIPLRSET